MIMAYIKRLKIIRLHSVYSTDVASIIQSYFTVRVNNCVYKNVTRINGLSASNQCVQGFFQKISQEGAKPGFGEIWGGKVESNNMP